MSWPYYLSPLIPAAVVLRLLDAPETVVFFTSAVGLIPPAALMGQATEELAARAGPGIGGILNVTFGNAPELIVALFALGEGLHEVVKASLVGSVVGNILLVLGAAMFFGGRRVGEQRFKPAAVRIQTRMLLLAGLGPIALAAYALIAGEHLPAIHAARLGFGSDVEAVSAVLCGVLILLYVVTLRASQREYAEMVELEGEVSGGWSVRRSIGVLAFAAVLVGVMSEVLVHSIEAASDTVGLSQFFVGAVVVAIVGNAAEHWVAVLVAVRDKMDLSVSIAIGSSAQVALLVTPILGLASFAIGPAPMPLVLNWPELVALGLSVAVAAYITHNGRTNWREGALLLSLYAALAVAFGVA